MRAYRIVYPVEAGKGPGLTLPTRLVLESCHVRPPRARPHPRLRRAVHPAHRSPHPRAARLLRDPPVHRPLRADSRDGPPGHHPLGRPGERLRRRRADASTRASSSSACPCSASATACSSSRTCSAARSSAASAREYGHARVVVERPEGVFHRFAKREALDVWMSHGDRIAALPPGFQTIGVSGNTPFCAVGNASKRIYGVQFHPEVVHTPRGADVLASFLFDVAGLAPDLDRRAPSPKRPSPSVRARVAPDDHVHLRAVGRRRLVGGGRALPQGPGRPPHVHLRRQRPAPAWRGRAGGGDVPRELPPEPRRRRRAASAS